MQQSANLIKGVQRNHFIFPHFLHTSLGYQVLGLDNIAAVSRSL